jgi:hypothetical protein
MRRLSSIIAGLSSASSAAASCARNCESSFGAPRSGSAAQNHAMRIGMIARIGMTDHGGLAFGFSINFRLNTLRAAEIATVGDRRYR